MRKVRVVIADADKARAFEVRAYRAGFLRAGATEALAGREAEARVGPARAVGTVHAEAELECPEGLPNCRNCGDPAYAETCRADGHCPNCGTAHGVAPDATLAANGFALEMVE